LTLADGLLVGCWTSATVLVAFSASATVPACFWSDFDFDVASLAALLSLADVAGRLAVFVSSAAVALSALASAAENSCLPVIAVADVACWPEAFAAAAVPDSGALDDASLLFSAGALDICAADVCTVAICALNVCTVYAWPDALSEDAAEGNGPRAVAVLPATVFDAAGCAVLLSPSETSIDCKLAPKLPVALASERSADEVAVDPLEPAAGSSDPTLPALTVLTSMLLAPVMPMKECSLCAK
jgi:hypothetical protein